MNKVIRIWRRVCYGILLLDAVIIGVDLRYSNYSGALLVLTAAACLWIALLFMNQKGS